MQKQRAMITGVIALMVAGAVVWASNNADALEDVNG